ncbi:MAG: hypothetical protein IPI43_02520 [Sandaracinaceae bacterium]|nr:hypothetical protein [Sandaracinaceae bacterium]
MSDSPIEAPEQPEARPTPSRLRRWTLRLLKGVVGLLVLLVALVLAAYGALQTHAGRQVLLDRLVPMISGLIPGEIHVGSITEARTGGITLRDIVVLDREGLEVLRVRQARTLVRFSSLLRGRVGARVAGGARRPRGASHERARGADAGGGVRG